MVIDGWTLKAPDDLLQRDLEAFEGWIQGNPHPVLEAYDDEYERQTLRGELSGRSRLAAASLKAARHAGLDIVPDGDIGAMKPAEVRRVAQDIEVRLGAIKARRMVTAALEAGWFVECGDAGDLPDDAAIDLLYQINMLYADVTRIPEKKS